MDTLAGFNSANELATQLITLATGILALSITFTKDVLNSAGKVTWPLKLSWVAYLFSVVFGMWTMMAVTGSIFKAVTNPTLPMTYESNIAIPALAQILTFVVATILLIIYGAKMLKQKAAV